MHFALPKPSQVQSVCIVRLICKLVVRGLRDLYAYQNSCEIRVVVCEIWAENQRVQNLPFFGNCAHSSYKKITIVVDYPTMEHGQDLLLDGPFEVSKILVYTLSFAFAFSYQQCTSSLGVLQINLYHRESKAIWKASNNRFPILELLFDPKEEASRWKVSLTKLVLLRCNSNSTYYATASRRKLYSTARW
jgi:hypothetical protein